MNFLSAGLIVFAGLVAAQPAAAQFGFGSERDIELVERYDVDGDGYLDRNERDAARYRGRQIAGGRAPTMAASPDSEGLRPDEVLRYGDEPLYDPEVLRTLFIDFEYADWEQELEAFHGTDVEVPARVTVDGTAYEDVGIHFRGNTSFSNVARGYKRGLNLSFDHVHEDQRLYGYRTLNLLNAYGDPTFLRQVLYLQIANAYYPAPKANFVRVVINGEDWGIYVNVQQFNSDFTREAHDTNEARWRIPGSFSSRGGLEYLGDNLAAYQATYDIKNKDETENWQALMELTRILNRTSPELLVEALEPVFDIDEALRFLAVDNALLNSDGYWSRNSDYSLYRDEDGRFHVTSYDTNEAMREAGGGFGRFRGGFGGSATGVALSPLEGSRDGSKALLYRLLMVPELRARYLGYVRDVAENWLDWDRLGPIAERYRALIADYVADDSHKLYSTSDFDLGFDGAGSRGGGGFGGPPALSVRNFVEQRQAYLLEWLDANAAGQTP